MQSSNPNANGVGEELNGVQRQINKKTNESLESTRRMLGLVAESQEVGTNTMIALDEQGEKLNKIEVIVSLHCSAASRTVSAPFPVVSSR
jgi:hypothetical protein